VWQYQLKQDLKAYRNSIEIDENVAIAPKHLCNKKDLIPKLLLKLHDVVCFSFIVTSLHSVSYLTSNISRKTLFSWSEGLKKNKT
jgi:hypothetical protein